MPDMQVVYPATRETRSNVRSVLFLFEDEGQELLDGGGRDIVPVSSLDERLVRVRGLV